MLRSTRKIRKQVMIVSADTDMSDAAASLLGKEKLRCECFGNLRDAKERWAEAIAASTFPFAALVVDGEMPDGDPLGFCSNVRNEHPMPLLFLSGKDVDAEYGRVLVDQVGVDLVLNKPISLNVLASNILHLVAHQGARTSVVHDAVNQIMHGADRTAAIHDLAAEFSQRMPERLDELDAARDAFLAAASMDGALKWRQVAQRTLSGAGTFGFHGLMDAASELEAKLGDLISRHQSEKWGESEIAVIQSLQQDVRSAFELHRRAIPVEDANSQRMRHILLLFSRPGSAMAARLFSALDEDWQIEVASSLLSARDIARDTTIDLTVIDCDHFPQEEADEISSWAELSLASQVLAFTSQPAYERGADNAPTLARLLPTDDQELKDLLHDAASNANTWRVVVVEAGREVGAIIKRALPPTVEVFHVGESHEIEQELVDLEPGFIVMDMNLNAYDGRDICRKLRRRAALSTVPLLITTDDNNPAERIAIFEAGADDYMLKPMPEREVRARVLGRLKRDNILRNMSRTDPLTGLNNRREFTRAFASQMDATVRDGTKMCVVMVDLDHFKEVNDKHGHAAGDSVLKTFARLLRSSTRTSDLLGRLGGEEFGVVLRRTDVDGAVEVVERIRRALAKLTFHDSSAGPYQVTMSAGIAVFPENGKSLDELLNAADNALYEAKHEGRDRIIIVPAK